MWTPQHNNLYTQMEPRGSNARP